MYVISYHIIFNHPAFLLNIFILFLLGSFPWHARLAAALVALMGSTGLSDSISLPMISGKGCSAPESSDRKYRVDITPDCTLYSAQLKRDPMHDRARDNRNCDGSKNQRKTDRVLLLRHLVWLQSTRTEIGTGPNLVRRAAFVIAEKYPTAVCVYSPRQSFISRLIVYRPVLFECWFWSTFSSLDLLS